MDVGREGRRAWSLADRSPLKFSFEVLVRSLELRPRIQCDRMSVLWTRGSKAAHTREVAVNAGRALIEEKLCLLCTLLRDDKRRAFDRKLCTFTVVQRSGIKLGRACIDLSRWASLEQSTPSVHAVDVLRGGIVVGTLALEISSRWLRDYLRQAGIAADDASSLCSDPACSGDEGGDDLSDGDDDGGGAPGDSPLERGDAREGEAYSARSDSDSDHGGLSPSGSATTPARRGTGARAPGGARALAHRLTSRELSAGSDTSASARADERLQAQLADERATRRELEAELAAHADSLRRRESARTCDDAGRSARVEARALREQLAEADVRHAAAEGRWRLELSTARREKESALAELRTLAAEREAALEGQLASVQGAFGERLARAEEQRQTISRRLGKTAKSSESALAQMHAENSLLEARADALENELCEALDARRRQSATVAELTRRVGELELMLGDGGERRADHARGPAERAAVADLTEELAVSRSVRDALRADISKLERELVATKLTRAQDEEEKGQLRRQLRASKARQLALAERMTELEVRLAEAFSEGSLAEERIAEAFSSVIRDLELQLADKRGR
ncbi:hypothetical protein KFE25_006044 [Diacronema lutheri]|uniref:C2 NT-type domain-containing protein n=1 Tax=Diacronema lutheri TaxID=2081491 RepID=A0A8J5XSA0_DIALT|nr:hypothetical protein KFE25_006044 [Diacronema lutheri]